jgi:hypothetical protein
VSGVRAAFANIAIKADLAKAEAWLTSAEGGAIVARHEVDGDRFLEARLGETVVMVFARALYERPEEPLPDGLLHTSHRVERLDDALADPAWTAALIWGPREISGGFGRRRIAFFEVLPGVRIELMEELVDA